MAKRAYLIIVVVLIIASIVLISNPFKSSEGPEQTAVDIRSQGKEIGDVAFDLTFKSFDGKEVKFSDFQGQLLVVNAWAAWCPFCIEEMPLFQKVSNENDDVTILFIQRTATESKSRGASYLEGFAAEGIPITDPILEDPDDEFYNRFFGFGMPVTLFIGKDGKIVDKKVGPFTEEEFREKVKLLK